MARKKVKAPVKTLSGKDRLLLLADHIVSAKRGHKTFDFSKFNWDGGIGRCGSAGCALGECPILFPDDWEFGVQGAPVTKKQGTILLNPDPFADAARFFEIGIVESLYLFSPDRSGLGVDASEQQVRDHIINFVKHGMISSS